MKERDLKIEIYPIIEIGHVQYRYGNESHKVFLPNLIWLKPESSIMKKIVINALFHEILSDINHEILHKILHEFVGFRAMNDWDNIDKKKNKYILSKID